MQRGKEAVGKNSLALSKGAVAVALWQPMEYRIRQDCIMRFLGISVAVILLPLLAAGAESGLNLPLFQNVQTDNPVSKSNEGPAGNETTESAEDTKPSDLKQIDAFKIELDDASFEAAPASDKALAVIVNPFTVRKRGWYYGSVYIYHRNDNFDARNFFDPVGQPLPEYKRNQFGFTLGARIGSKMTLFGAYDGLRISRGNTKLSLIPTPQMKQGDFSAMTETKLVDPFTGSPFPNNRIPADRIHPVSLKMLRVLPSPNRDDPTRNFVNNDPTIDNSNDISMRVDYEINRKTKLFGNYSIDDGRSISIASLPEFSTEQSSKLQRASIELTHSFSPQSVLNIDLSFLRYSNVRLSKHAFQTGLLESLGIRGVSVLDDMDEGYPDFQIFGYAGLGSSGSPNTRYFNDYIINAGYTYIHGGHSIGISGNSHTHQVNNNRTWGTRRGSFGFSGYFSGEPFADFLLGIPYTASRGIGSDRSDLRQRTLYLSGRDDWKINRKWTLSMGLSYAYEPFPRSIHDNVSFFFPLVFEPPLDGELIVTGSERARELGLTLAPGEATYPDRNDWAPSFGVTYSPLGNNRLVLRANYSLEHNNMSPIQGTSHIGKNYPFFYVEKAESPTSPDMNLSDPFTSVIPAENTIRAVDPHYRNAYNQSWSASLQYEIVQFWNLKLSYWGLKSTNNSRTIPANVPLPAPAGEPIQPRRPNPDFGGFTILTSGGASSSNSFEARIQRRMRGIFSVQAVFEWERSFSDVTSQPNDPRNLAAERAVSSGGPFSFNANFLLDVPVGPGRFYSSAWAGKLAFLLEGWRISGIGKIESGGLFNPELFGDPNNDGVQGDRPNRIGSGILPGSERSVDKWFETSHFEFPDLTGTNPQWFGNSGRNILAAPGNRIWDISFIKSTRITDTGHLLELRIQLFNAFNHANFYQPGSMLGTSTFGVISNAGHAREMEIAMKYSF